MRRPLVLLALACSVATAGIPPLLSGFGLGGGLNPLSLPQVTSSTFSVTYLGSFTLPAGTSAFYNASGAMSVSGSTLYIAANCYDPYDRTLYGNGDGIGAVTIPTLIGPPAYNGSNGSAATVFTPTCGANTGNYSLTGAPGSTSATFTTLPPAFDSSGKWYVTFTGSDTESRLVTGLTGSTFSWSSPLGGTGYAASASVWHQPQPFGAASGDRVTGSIVYNGKLLITGAAYYDASCNANLGWIIEANTDGTGWGSVNTVVNYPSQLGASAALAARNFAGQLYAVPIAWQSILGGSMSVAAGLGALSNIQCKLPYGFSFATFDPSSVTSTGAAVSIHTLIDYFDQGNLTDAWPEQLTGRTLSGPFPTTVSPGYAATLTAAPSAGATSVTLALPGNTTVTANLTSGSSAMAVTAGTVSDSGVYYDSSDTAGCLGASGRIWPAYDYAPGTSLGSGDSFTMHNVASCSASGDSITLTDGGYQDGYYTITFSDGETRVVHLQAGNSAVPSVTSGTNDAATFAPLTCSPSCTASITIAPNGDALASVYDGPFGGPFVYPGSSSLVMIGLHQSGPGGARADQCIPGASGTNEIPVSPDTSYYVELDVRAYSLNAIATESNVYQPKPTMWKFPGESSLHESTSPNCLIANTNGFTVFDPSDDYLYMAFSNGIAGGNANPTVFVWKVNPL